MRKPAAIMVIYACLWSAPGLAGELGTLLWEVLQHPQVLAAQNRRAASNQRLAAATARYFGSGGLLAETSRFEGRRFVGIFSPASLAAPPFARQISRYGVFYRLPIDLSGAIAASRRAAGYDLAAAKLAERQAILLKLHDATSAYVRLQALQRQKVVLAIQRQRVEKTVARVAKEVETGQAAIPELRLAEAELARLQSDAVRLDGSIEEAQVAMEEAVEQRMLPASDQVFVPPWPAAGEADLLPTALARQQELATQARAEETRRALWPEISVDADFFEFNGGRHTPDTWSVGAKVNLPLDLAAWKKAGAAKSAARAAVYARQAARREAHRNWTALRAAYQSARANAEALGKEVVAREEVVRVQAELQRVGMASLEDFLRQLRDRLEAESRRTDALARAVISWSAAQILLGSSAEHYIDSLDQTGPD